MPADTVLAPLREALAACHPSVQVRLPPTTSDLLCTGGTASPYLISASRNKCATTLGGA